MAWLTGLLASPRNIAILVGVIAVLGFAIWVRGLMSENSELQQKVFEQSIIIQQKDAEIETAQKIAEAAAAARDIASAALAEARDRANKLGEVRTRIIRAPVEDDGPVAPVIENALDALRTPVEVEE